MGIKPAVLVLEESEVDKEIFLKLLEENCKNEEKQSLQDPIEEIQEDKNLTIST